MAANNNTLPGPANIVRRELPNGIVVLVRENHYAPSVIITGSVNAGGLFDVPDTLGLASFAASMLMRGTEQRDFTAIHELLESNGASLGISGGRHTAGFSGKSLAEDLPMLIELLAEALRRPVFPEVQLDRLRGQLLTSLKIHEQDTRYMAGKLFRELVYSADHPYHYSTDGTVETISAIRRDHLLDFHRQFYGPSGMMIVIVGAVESEAAIRLVEDYFGDWQNPTQPPLPDLPSLAPPQAVQTQIHTMPGKSQSDLVWGTPGPSRFAEDWHAANLANNILGVFGMYGRIGAEVREKRGMAYYSFSRLDGGIGPGAWRVVAGVNPANVEAAVEAIRGEIRRLVTEPVSVQELADNKANFIGRLPLQLESNEGVAGVILMMERYELGLDYLQHYAATINAVTAEEVLVSAQRYLDPDV
ncbi:MAG: insulinase family protein, partial [Chloroflexi bacterium]|nr:insulinase family protein [Chloroflexota bacterium]